MNAKKKVGIIAVVVILAIAFIAIAFLATQKSTNYYTQIDNDWVTEIAPHGAMNYRYTLAACDENGDEKELTFETSKILTDDAFLCLKVAPFRGVVTGQKRSLRNYQIQFRKNIVVIYNYSARKEPCCHEGPQQSPSCTAPNCLLWQQAYMGCRVLKYCYIRG